MKPYLFTIAFLVVLLAVLVFGPEIFLHIIWSIFVAALFLIVVLAVMLTLASSTNVQIHKKETR